jgi:hypothetical protein
MTLQRMRGAPGPEGPDARLSPFFPAQLIFWKQEWVFKHYCNQK